jgi:hypothetical protein
MYPFTALDSLISVFFVVQVADRSTQRAQQSARRVGDVLLVRSFTYLTCRYSSFCLNLGWLYTRLVAHNSFAPVPPPVNNYEGEESPPPTEQTALLARKSAVNRLNNSITEFMAMCVFRTRTVSVPRR